MPQSSAQPMQDLLEQLASGLERLLLILREEATRLQQRNIHELDCLLVEKQQALQAIESLEGQRRQLLSTAGFTVDKAGMRQYLQEHCAPTQLVSWEAVLVSLQQVQALNEANGRIIHRSLEQTGQMLAILRGDDSQSANLYGPSGQPSRSGSSSLTRA